MEAALDALIGEELEALGEELSMFLEPTCDCIPTPRSHHADRQPTRKKRKKQKRKPQVAKREDNQEAVPLSQEEGVLIFPSGTIGIVVDEEPSEEEEPGHVADVRKPNERESETEPEETKEEPKPFVRIPVDVVETHQGTHFVVDAPGIDREAMHVEVAKKSLTISGVKREDDLLVEAGGKVKRKERAAGPFVRKFRLPASADLDRAYSSYRDGVLHITVPKRAPSIAEKPAVIAIPVHDRWPTPAQETAPSGISQESAPAAQPATTDVPTAGMEAGSKSPARHDIPVEGATKTAGHAGKGSPKKGESKEEPRIIPLAGA